MSFFKPDILIKLSFPVQQPEEFVIKTNAKPEVVPEILTNWIQAQVGQGKDDSVAVQRDVYSIKIGLLLEDDSFGTESDTGNKGLTAGIVLDVAHRLGAGQGTVKSLDS